MMKNKRKRVGGIRTYMYMRFKQQECFLSEMGKRALELKKKKGDKAIFLDTEED